MLETIVETFPKQFRLSFTIENLGAHFLGFTQGNFVVLYGSTKVLPLSMFLCVKAQLPCQLGGLETNVIFVDGGNTFQLYDVSYFAQLHEINPREALERILISRAFTAYQMTSLLSERLQRAVKKYNSKLVIISDIARLYLDKNIPQKEAKDVFNQLTVYLSKFAKAKRVIVIATFLPHRASRRSIFFKEVISGRADVVAFVGPSLLRAAHACMRVEGYQFALEKHPFFNFEDAYLQRKSCIQHTQN